MTADAPVVVCNVRCPRCGIANPDEARFCSRCGESIAVPHAAPENGGRKPMALRNGYATAGLWLGIASVFLAEFGIVPLLAIIFSFIGLGKADERDGAGRFRALFGLILGILYMFVNLHMHGHI